MNLLKKIESESIQKEKTHIFYLGQSGYVLKTQESVLYIDPYLSDYVEHPDGLNEKSMKRNFPPPVNPMEIQIIDAVLCTHSHADHMDPWTLEKIDQDFKLISTENAYLNNPVELPSESLEFIGYNNSIMINNIKIEAIPAAHYQLASKDGKPDCVSFIIKAFGKTLFFWGDGVIYTGLFAQLEKYTFDAFFAPINGRDWFREQRGIIGNINARELAELCQGIHVDLVIPNHCDLFDYYSEYTQYFNYYLNKFAPEQSYKILSYGDVLII